MKLSELIHTKDYSIFNKEWIKYNYTFNGELRYKFIYADSWKIANSTNEVTCLIVNNCIRINPQDNELAYFNKSLVFDEHASEAKYEISCFEFTSQEEVFKELDSETQKAVNLLLETTKYSIFNKKNQM